jgi:hypothetical protein
VHLARVSRGALGSARQHTSAYVSLRQHTSAYVRILIIGTRAPSTGIARSPWLCTYIASLRQYLYFVLVKQVLLYWQRKLHTQSLQQRQCLSFCTSKASRLRTCSALLSWRSAAFLSFRSRRRVRPGVKVMSRSLRRQQCQIGFLSLCIHRLSLSL